MLLIYPSTGYYYFALCPYTAVESLKAYHIRAICELSLLTWLKFAVFAVDQST